MQDYALDEILAIASEENASDVHITVNLPPMMRVDGRLRPMDFERLEPRESQRLIYSILTDHQISSFEENHELDFSHGIAKLGRFRVNVYFQRGSVAAAFRLIPRSIPAFDELGLPGMVRRLAGRTSGLMLVTGPTGSGKSTTLAAIVEHINKTREAHVITIEDPIEYLHRHQRSMVNQRELGSDTYGWATALRSVLREDPDVVLIGEMRDLDTIDAALKIAETGHLVLGTLHTRNAPQSIDRIIDVFPPHHQEQIRVLLASTLEAVVAQQLLPRIGGLGRTPAVEVMIVTAGIRNLIREGKTHQIYALMETGGEEGMQTMDRALASMVRQGLVAADEAEARAIDRDNFRRWLSTL
ncbi:MAG: type IV pilus twitching motility protein PilT [Armatimonadota bacterium]|nr:MAG: type IV pilus twitching motility protein PilT [Armatimonadota bacterium]